MSTLFEWIGDNSTTFQWTSVSILDEFSPAGTGTSEITFQLTFHRNNSIVLSFFELPEMSSAIMDQLVLEEMNVPSQEPQQWETERCYDWSPGIDRCDFYSFDKYICPDSAVAVPKCPEGQYLSISRICATCIFGTYQTGQGMLFEGNCTKCETGTFSTASGSSSSDACINCTQANFGCDPEEPSVGALVRENINMHWQKASENATNLQYLTSDSSLKFQHHSTQHKRCCSSVTRASNNFIETMIFRI
jgi:hypothetical protein